MLFEGESLQEGIADTQINKQEDVHIMNFFKNVNKWFYAFVVAAVLLVTAVVIAVVLGVGSQGKTPDANAPT